MGPLNLLLLLLLLASPALSAVTITHLPGFRGPLPFHLETGYVTVDEVNGVELFYYFIESERNPSEDPLLLWLTGGPGCSAFSGLVFEIGPLQFVTARYNGSLPTLVYKHFSWTKITNIIFLDAPVGTGFSFSRSPEGYVVGDTASSERVYEFLKKWFIEHPRFLSNDLYIAGDSYAGKTVPVVTNEVVKGIEAGHSPLLNLKGYLIGNPATGEQVDYNSRVPYAHGVGIISDELFEAIQTNCMGENYLNPNPLKLQCISALNKFEMLTSEINKAYTLDPHCPIGSPHRKHMFGHRSTQEKHADIVLPPEFPDLKCRSYPYFLSYYWANNYKTRKALHIKKVSDPCLDLSHIVSFLHLSIRASIHVPSLSSVCSYLQILVFLIGHCLWRFVNGSKLVPTKTDSESAEKFDEQLKKWEVLTGTVDEWVRCNKSLAYTSDIPSNVIYHLNLTMRGYRALVYSGDKDMLIPFLGTQQWIRSLGYSIADDWRSWHVDGQVAGYTRVYNNNLTFTTVKDAGHTAPEYKPENCLAMLDRWISHRPL